MIAWLGWIIAGCCFWYARGERNEAQYWFDMYIDVSNGEHSIDKWVRDAREERIRGIRRIK